MKNAIKRGLAALGCDVVFLHNRAGGTVGVRVQSIRRKDEHLVAGHVAVCEAEGRTINFFIANEIDEIQGTMARGRFYEQEELALIGKYFKGGVFVDVGANVGNHTLYAAMILGAARVISFEPNPATAIVLRMNVAINDLMTKVVVHQAGLAEKPGRAVISDWPEYNQGAVQLATADAGNLVLQAGDEVLSDEQVAFIKVDVEGMELSALRGLTATMRRCKPNMFVEVAPSNTEGFKAFVAAQGYEIAETYERYATLVNYLIVPATQPH